LVDAGQKRDIEAALVKNRGVLLKWLTARLGNASDADDVLQAVYVRVWAYADTALIDNPRALIFKAAARLATNELVRRARGLTRHDDASDEAIEALPTADPNPEQQALLKQDVERTLAAISDLPPRVRQAFELSRFDGKTYAEIAVDLGVSESSVEKYIIDALKRLRVQLRPGESGRVVPFRRIGS
jgi:RNA polymerase sigma-70 factor (ECF subfamily)